MRKEGGEREEKREMARLGEGARRRELRHLWCSQGNGKVAIAGRTRLAIGGLMCRGEGGTNKAGSECFKHCCVGDKSMNKGLISEDRSNKATLLLTIPCSLLSRLQRIYRSQYLRLKSVWRWAEAYCCACDRESGNNHRDLAWIPA